MEHIFAALQHKLVLNRLIFLIMVEQVYISTMAFWETNDACSTLQIKLLGCHKTSFFKMHFTK